jgi:hypothetical protein
VRERIMSGHDQAGFEAEVRERWGETDAYQKSSRRTKSYSEHDLAKVKAESDGIEAGLAAAMADGDAADGERAMDLAEAARLHIDRWFYPCSTAMHAGLAEMYTADERFKAHYEDRAEGLAEYVAAAIKANAGRA